MLERRDLRIQLILDDRFVDPPVFLACHASDPHIPLRRVRETADVFERLGARVNVQIHPGAGHGIVADDVRTIRALLTHPVQ